MLLLFQATATQVADSTQVVADKLMKEAIANADGLDKLSLITQQLLDFAIRAGERILIAVIVFIVGRFLISMLNRFVGRLMDRRKVDISIKTFVKSLVNILLTILLIISVVGALGVETTSFAALLASAGVAVGMALSGNLQNFAGGLIVLLFKPYKVGDWIESRGVSGTVAACGTGHCRRGFHGAERIGEQHDEGRAREGRGAFPEQARLPLFGRGTQPEKPRKPRVAEKNRGVGAFFSRRKLDK